MEGSSVEVTWSRGLKADEAAHRDLQGEVLGASGEALEGGRPNHPPRPSLLQGPSEGVEGSQPASPPLAESRGNPHHRVPYVDPRAAEYSPAQGPPRTPAPFVSRQLRNNF